MSTNTSAQVRESAGSRRTAEGAAVAAALLLVANGVIGLLGDVDDHTAGLGLLSEVTAGVAFLGGAVALALLCPVTGLRRVLWWLGPVGMTVTGATMIGVPVIGSEPAEWLFVVAVLPTLVGTVSAGVLGAGRLWPWWTGAGLALLLPVMFLLPFNSFVMAAIWFTVGRVVRAERPVSVPAR